MVRVRVLMLALAALAGCAQPALVVAPARGLQTAGQSAEQTAAQIADLTAQIRALGPGVDPAEAARAARIAVLEPLDWARDWQVVDPPLVHNFKVVNGYRDKGVCQDWADALEIALHAQGFRTLQLHRAIANARNIALEHATVIVSARGARFDQGLILDPWRIGQGRLFVSPVTQDPRYRWESRDAVRAWHAAWKARAAAGG